MSRYDPRINSAVTLSVNEKVSFGRATDEQPLQAFVLGPHVKGPVQRPATAHAAGRDSDPKPSFLQPDGKWSIDVPSSPSSPMSGGGTPRSIFNQTMWSPTGSSGDFNTTTFSRAGRSLRPASAVHSYGDRSPLTLQDHVTEVYAGCPTASQTISPYLQATTRQRAASAGPSRGHASGNLNGSFRPGVTTGGMRSVGTNTGYGTADGKPPPVTAASAAAWGLGAATAHATAAIRSPSARVDPLRESVLTIDDICRDGSNLGKACIPGSHNTKLVGGRWRYISAPIQGDVVYTDYYGRCGADRSNYYGRAYHVDTTEFAKNKLVGDIDYKRVQASMQGISGLRTRPGLVLRSAINNGSTAKLLDLPVTGGTATGLHRIQEFYNMRPGSAGYGHARHNGL